MPTLYIVAAKRSPIGKYKRAFAGMPAPQIAAPLIAALLRETTLDPKHVNLAIFGNALPAGLGQNPARQAALLGGLSDSVSALTINSVCGAGMHGIILAAQAIALGEHDLAIAGGMENMTRAPLLTHDSYEANRESLLYDGLLCALTGEKMGETAERLAIEYVISREAQDAFALESHRRAISAEEQGIWTQEIEPINGHTKDEAPRADTSKEKLSMLAPSFSASGTVTAGNACPIADGAAAVVLASEDAVKKHDLQPLAIIKGWASIGLDPKRMGLGAQIAAETCLQNAKMTASEIDTWEINEAFSSQILAVLKELRIDPARVNVHGGSIALGHPIGASGARIVVTLAHELRRSGKRYGMASICIGGGQGAAILLERV